MSYEKLKQERDILKREVQSVDAIVRDNFHILVGQSNNRASIGLCGSENRNRKASDLELETLSLIKEALLKYAKPMRERIVVIDKKLSAADELLKETSK